MVLTTITQFGTMLSSTSSSHSSVAMFALWSQALRQSTQMFWASSRSASAHPSMRAMVRLSPLLQVASPALSIQRLVTLEVQSPVSVSDWEIFQKCNIYPQTSQILEAKSAIRVIVFFRAISRMPRRRRRRWVRMVGSLPAMSAWSSQMDPSGLSTEQKIFLSWHKANISHQRSSKTYTFNRLTLLRFSFMVSQQKPGWWLLVS